MATEVALQVARDDLDALLDRMQSGESVELIGPDGEPVAMLVSLRHERVEPLPDEEWFARWDDLAKRIDKAWKSEKTALEVLAEMRR